MNETKSGLKLRELNRVILPIIVSMIGLLALLRCLNGLGLLPKPSVSTHPDLTVLIHQFRASRERDPAKVVLLGDSTCLMGVDARELSQRLPEKPRVLSLALLIWLDLGVYGQVLSDFAKANPDQVRSVVLLVSPAKLAEGGESAQGTESEIWRQVQLADRRASFQEAKTPPARLGINLLRENVFSHLLDTPTRPQGEAFFGFSSQVDGYMSAHQGSLLEPGTFLIPRRRQTAKWTLSPAFEAETRVFRARVPSGAKLFIGLTPIAKITSNPGDRDRRDELLRAWNRTMNADGVLTNLPVTLPDVYFSKTGHLNEFGQRKYTACLRQALATALKSSPGIGPETGAIENPKPVKK